MAKTPKKQYNWPKEAIREEIRKIDAKTGLSGAKITVRMYDAPEPLALFTFIDPARMTFGFSRTRFEEPGFTRAEALDIIRHEYAHFMEYHLFGESSDHGPNWQKCCVLIGARPEKLYTEKFRQQAREAEKERARRTRTDGFEVGQIILHPAYGEGMIESIEKNYSITKLRVVFDDRTRILDIDWVRKNCSFL